MVEQILEAIAAAIYTTDAAGRITYFNKAAAELWGVRPELGESRYCGSWKLYRPDGTVLPHGECPMAVALKEGRRIDGEEAVIERPDGSRVPFLAYPSPLFDADGRLVGAVNLMIDISGHTVADLAVQRLAAIVESSDDAILAKDLNGIITSWNRGAERLFGYTAEEAIGRPVLMLIPADRQHEEPEILARIRSGLRMEHYETVRRRKDGSLVEVSISVSPIVDASGRIVGASKIGRDITERRRVEEQKDLLLREMNHRVKNLFSLSSGLVRLSAREATAVDSLVDDLQARFGSLARAHSLTLPSEAGEAFGERAATTIHALIGSVTQPFLGEAGQGDVRLLVSGPDIPVAGSAVSSLALVLHEFATNAVKYGALARPNGMIGVRIGQEGDEVSIVWEEPGVSAEAGEMRQGFGTRLALATINRSLGGTFSREFTADGLEIRMSLSRERLGG